MFRNAYRFAGSFSKKFFKRAIFARSFTSAVSKPSSSLRKIGTIAAIAFGVAGGFYASTIPRVEATETVPKAGVPGTNIERTFIAVKPDGVQRGLVGEIVSRFEKRGYKLVGIKMITPTKEFTEEHYADLKGRSFFPGLVRYFSSGPVVAMVFEGKDAVANGRSLIGATNPAAAAPGSIRGDFCISVGRNIIHGSDTTANAQSEINLWFKDNEVSSYDVSHKAWIYE
eukprot:TRINITY_DN475_c0_g2_i1.p1 TRINITY_DN475_c0_g2~~TRINITY_DN475_c0_g2_i1.p1  ORF type:complete len:227 (-),score=117.22 TRINITY_DN475_c0_g2_i1:107-787(-)